MTRVATAGNCVIVGRGAPYFLRELPTRSTFFSTLHGRKSCGAAADRDSDKEAEELVDTVDRDRIEFVKHYFGADWPTRCLYHMMINTAVGNEIVVATVLDTMRLLEKPVAAGGVPQLEKCP